MISCGPGICSRLETALEREWLETNGLGGFASSTIAGINTRRYHGLLTAALSPPVGRYVLLSKFEEVAVLDGERFELSANFYPGTVYPHGFIYLTNFRLEPFPTFTWTIQDLEIRKRIFMVHGENTVVAEYDLPARLELELRPLIAFRDYHSTTHENAALDPSVQQSEGRISVQPYGSLPRLRFAHNASGVASTGDWYRSFEYPLERERGLDFTEDLFQPFVMRFAANATVIASLDEHHHSDAAALRQREIERRKKFATSPLAAAADSFIVRRGAGLHTIIAGYHWFSDWGRDTMIALPGLTLATGRFDIARDILLAFSEAVNQGMLPNRFPDSGEAPEYNTVDASLWFFEAARQYADITGDHAFVRERLHRGMRDILDWHLKGTRYNIHCDTDGLLEAGGPTTQLTWMDARTDGVAITPRNGKAVEIQALWYNALRIMNEDEKAARAQNSFEVLFWDPETDCLFDCVDGSARDRSIRPNQLFALSLTYPILTDQSRARSILRTVERELLTPYGLRTLSPKEPAYRPQCTGDAKSRDSAYHQGTVWPWLLGPYATACRRSGLPSPPLDALYEHMNTAGLGSVSEIFDGDAPHAPRGCIAQAWSVAELLRISRTETGDQRASHPPQPEPA